MSGATVRTWASVGLLVATFLGSLASLTSCRPFEKFWQIFPDPGVMCQSNISPLIIAVFLTCNILSDLYLVSLPIPVLLRAPLKKMQKLSLISLFSCTILITGMAIVRAYFIIRVSTQENTILVSLKAFLTVCYPIGPMDRRRWRMGHPRGLCCCYYHKHTNHYTLDQELAISMPWKDGNWIGPGQFRAEYTYRPKASCVQSQPPGSGANAAQ